MKKNWDDSFEPEMIDFIGKTFTEIKRGDDDRELIFIYDEGEFKCTTNKIAVKMFTLRTSLETYLI